MSDALTTSEAGAGADDRPFDPDLAARRFSRSMVISGIRCMLTYVVFPWLLPALGWARGVGPLVGLPIGLLAIGFNVDSIRRFRSSDRRMRLPVMAINAGVIILLSVLVVGDVDDHSRRLVAETRIAMDRGIDAVRPAQPVHAIGRAIERHAHRHGLGVVREFIGHGIGTEFHSGLQVKHYFDPSDDTMLVAGMTFTIEPMLTLGNPSCALWDDDWTAVTLDGRRTAQFEHTVLVTEDGVERLTVLPDGTLPADLFA